MYMTTTMLSRHKQRPLCVSLYDLMGKSFWSGINTTKELLTGVSIIEKQPICLVRSQQHLKDIYTKDYRLLI